MGSDNRGHLCDSDMDSHHLDSVVVRKASEMNRVSVELYGEPRGAAYDFLQRMFPFTGWRKLIVTPIETECQAIPGDLCKRISESGGERLFGAGIPSNW